MNIDDLYLSTNSSKSKVYIVCTAIPDEFAGVTAWENSAVFSTEEKAKAYFNKLISSGYREYDAFIEEMELQ